MSCLRSERLITAALQKQDSKPYGKAVYLNKEELKDTQEILSEGSAFIYSRFHLSD